MKLIRFGEAGEEKPGVILPDGRWVDVSAFGQDFDEDFFRNNGLDELKQWISELAEVLPEVSQDERLGPPIKRPSKIVCIGLNYAKHAKESGMEIPEEPVIFFKSNSAIVGPNDNFVIPKNGSKADWEVELAVVIGERTSYVSVEEANDYIAGYMLHNDYSERGFQLDRSGQWVKGKSADTFAPIGPFMATRDEIEDPHNLDLWLKVNGQLMQKGNTSDFIFNVPQLVSYVSQFMSLLPGDIISTGTPPGVGLGMDPPKYLQPGDVVELGIDGLGKSRQMVQSYEEVNPA
jgi:2-keto-4-pentenoate hydratase/2-oxohepta-3-ene-1,7-dioic acid hydratase in catechol pathway